MRRPAPPNSWSQAWISVQLGLAYSAAGKQELALAELTKGLQAGGVYDHLMTSLALLEMGDIHFQQGKYDAAGVFYMEATYSAVLHPNFTLQPDIQYVMSPGADPSLSDALVIGTRLIVAW